MVSVKAELDAEFQEMGVGWRGMQGDLETFRQKLHNCLKVLKIFHENKIFLPWQGVRLTPLNPLWIGSFKVSEYIKYHIYPEFWTGQQTV